MKKTIATVLALILLLTMGLASVPALAENPTAWVKMASGGVSLHLRQGPGKNYASVGYVKADQAIEVYFGQTAYDFEGEQWTRIRAGGKDGYIKTKYISYTAPSASSGSSGSAGTSASTATISVPGGVLYVRSGPGTGYSRAGSVFHGDRVSVLERGSTWSKIQVPSRGLTGYVMNKYLVGAAASAPTVTQPSAGGVSLVNGSYEVASIMTRTAAGVVNLRTGAGTGYSSVGTFPRGTILAVYGRSGDWYRVITSTGKTGYIHKNYVAFGVTGTTTASVNFRTGAGTGYSVIRALSTGTRVTVHSVTGDWAKVTASGRTGYVHIRYLKV